MDQPEKKNLTQMIYGNKAKLSMFGGGIKASIHIKGRFGRAPAPSKKAPALTSPVERLFRLS
jgi:hypothetical protein